MVGNWYRYDKPRLLGKLSYGIPYMDEITSKKDFLRIVPAKLPRGLMLFFAMAGIIGVAVACGLVMLVDRLPDRGFVISMGGLWAAASLVACGYVYVTFAQEGTRGPILIVSCSEKKVYMPRVARAWDFGQIVRCEIVRGTWVSDAQGRERRFADPISELQLVVEDEASDLVAWPILGGIGQHDPRLLEVAHELAKRMNVTLCCTNV